jgi:hypothetical protein
MRHICPFPGGSKVVLTNPGENRSELKKNMWLSVCKDTRDRS